MGTSDNLSQFCPPTGASAASPWSSFVVTRVDRSTPEALMTDIANLRRRRLQALDAAAAAAASASAGADAEKVLTSTPAGLVGETKDDDASLLGATPNEDDSSTIPSEFECILCLRYATSLHRGDGRRVCGSRGVCAPSLFYSIVSGDRKHQVLCCRKRQPPSPPL